MIAQQLEALDVRNKEISTLVVTYENSGNDTLDLKSELYANKLEMVQLLQEAKSGNILKATTLEDEITSLKTMPIKPKYETGIKAIDEKFNGGLELSQLIMIGGQKGAGKTAFALQYLINVSQGYKSCFISFEMPKWKIAQRLSKHNPNVNQKRNFYLFDKGRDISEIEVNVKKLAKDGIKFFSIDSLMKITNKSVKSSKHEQISDITNRLSRLCVELDIIIVLIVQVSKEDLKGGYMAVKGSGDADYDADIMFFLTKDKDDKTKRYFICEKNRQNGNEFKEEIYLNPKTVQLQEHKPSIYETCYTTAVDDKPKIDMEVI